MNYPQDDVPDLIRQIRTCESLDQVADVIVTKQQNGDDNQDAESVSDEGSEGSLETQLASKLGQLRVDHGATRFFGGTSTLLYDGQPMDELENSTVPDLEESLEDPVTSWTTVTDDSDLVTHLLDMYFTWHYTFFTILSKSLFYREFSCGKPPPERRPRVRYCTPLLVNAMLALGSHFSSRPGARAISIDSSTTGDHFFKEAKRLIMEDEEYENPRLPTVQALALMSVREAGCGREAKGWAYSGISFRMACDLGLNLDSGGIAVRQSGPDAEEEDARRITFWGCYLIDK